MSVKDCIDYLDGYGTDPNASYISENPHVFTSSVTATCCPCLSPIDSSKEQYPCGTMECSGVPVTQSKR